MRTTRITLAVAALVASGCARNPSPRPITPARDIAFTVSPPTANASVTYNGRPLRSELLNGHWLIHVPPGVDLKATGTLSVSADGFTSVTNPAFVLCCGELPVVALTRALIQRQGVVRLDGRTFTDDGGDYLAIGATLFWAHWGFLHDRDRIAHELEKLRGKADYIRVFMVCTWAERVVTVDDVLGSDSIRAFVDWVSSTYGLRVEWTIFSDAAAGSPAQRAAVIDRIGQLLGDRGDKVQHYEITNEGPITGWTPDELKALVAQLRPLVPNAVAATSVGVAGDDVAAWYGGSQANLFTVHLDRNTTGEGGMWRPARQCRDVPLVWRGAWTSNEPIGPKSSVASDDDPLRLVMAAALTYLCNGAGYVYHTGAGQTGGASYDVARGRETSIWTVPNIDTTLAGFAAVRSLLPPDLPNWSFQNNNARAGADHPFVTTPTLEQAQVDGRMLRAFAAVNGPRFVVMPLVVRAPLAFQAKQAMAFDVFDPMTAAKREHVELGVGETYLLQPTDAAILVGENR